MKNQRSFRTKSRLKIVDNSAKVSKVIWKKDANWLEFYPSFTNQTVVLMTEDRKVYETTKATADGNWNITFLKRWLADDGTDTEVAAFKRAWMPWTYMFMTVWAEDMEWKQDNLIAWTNIQIAPDWKTISATDTTYVASDFDIKDLSDSTSLMSSWSGKAELTDITTKLFTLSSTSDLTNAQAAYDYYADWTMPILKYGSSFYYLKSNDSTSMVFIKKAPFVWNWTSASTLNYESLTFALSSWTVTWITTWNSGIYGYSYLNTWVDYWTPYTPTYNGSPATKKYVDDSISWLWTAASCNTWTSAWNVPVLDANWKLDNGILPALAVTDTFVVSTTSDLTWLSNAEKWDIAIVTTDSETYILSADPYSTAANWKKLATPTDTVTSVNSKTWAVTLDADDIDDSTTTHKFVTATDITNLWNLSGTNTWDQSASDFDIKDLTDSDGLRTTWSWKQDTIAAWSNIQIAADGYTISATDTTYAASDFDIKDLSDSTSLMSTWSGKQDTMSAWAWIDITSNKISTASIYWVSTTAAATVQKEVSIPSITELNVWQVIIVKPTITSTVADSTLKLNSFDAYTMLYNGANISTSTDSIVWSANIPSMFLFDDVSGTKYWRFLWHWLDSNTTYTLNYLYEAWKTKAWSGSYAISRYAICMQKPDWTWETLKDTSTNYSTWTSKSANTNWFIPTQIRYYNTTTVVANGAYIGTNTMQEKCAKLTASYSFNCWGTPWWTVWQNIYLVWTISNWLFYLDTTARWTTTLPNSADWKVYILLWQALTTTDSTMTLTEQHPIFYHDGTSIRDYFADKQDRLISWTNIKTINNTSLLWSGNITISWGGGWTTVIEVTVSTAYWTAAKVWTTWNWNYTPTAWDLLLVNFEYWNTADWVTLNIDGSWAKNIKIWWANATKRTLNLVSSNTKTDSYMLMTYDGTNYVTYPWTNSTYDISTSSQIWLLKIWSDTQQTESAQAVTSTAWRTYAVQLNSSNQAVVNVPRQNTTYSASDFDIKDLTDSTSLRSTWSWKQDALVDWTNIKTVNWQNIMWSGDLTVWTVMTETAYWNITPVNWVLYFTTS